jgi:hypothetical protein
LNNSNFSVLAVEYLSSYGDPGPNYFVAVDYCQYVFDESPADNTSNVGYFYSNRSIVTTSSRNVYPVIDNLDGSSQTFQYELDGFIHTEYFQSIGPNSTTYFTSPDLGDCGPRCANVCEFENNGTAGFYYKCNVTVSDVQNATGSVVEQQVSDANAKIAAGAIALQGYQSENSTNQYQTFPAQSTYGTFQDGNSTQMATGMRQFSIGVFITGDQIINNIDPAGLSGFLPASGNVLSIDYNGGMLAILIGLAEAHLILLLIGIWVSNKVIVIEDEYLAIALLLNPVFNEYSDRGALLGGEERERIGEEMSVVYGLTGEDENGVKGLEISRDAECTRTKGGWEGWYGT